MRILLKLEEAAMFLFGLVLLRGFGLDWWWLLILFFAPDLAGAIIFTHSRFDRILGYGLKYPDSIQNTHLGRIGKA